MNIVENFLLVALKPDKPGFLISPEALGAGTVGALFIELLLKKSIEIKDSKVYVKRVPNSTTNPVDELLYKIHHSKKPKKAKFWISKFAHAPGKFKWFFLDNMKRKRYVRIDKKKFIFIPYRRTSLINKREREHLISGLRETLFHPNEITMESGSLLGLIGACKLQKVLCKDRSELRDIKLKLKTLIEREQISHDVDQVIKEMHAAVIAAVTASTGATAAAVG